MYLWRRPASGRWWIENEERLHCIAKDRLTVIERPDRKLLLLEAAFESRSKANFLRKKFGGRIEKLPRGWRKRFLRENTSKPLQIGKRLVISRSGGLSPSRRLIRAGGKTVVNIKSATRKPVVLVIPAGAAFGTGDHATTAMSLKLLEGITRSWKPGWKMIDLGTGSGILALAARRLGAKQSIAIDLDPLAVSTAKRNARLNKIDDVKFKVADVRRWKLPAKVDLVAANLFSELLIMILPKLNRSRFVILSGILRNQEKDMQRALQRTKMGIARVQRRGKWIAILADTGAMPKISHLKSVARRRTSSASERC
jgi:ribosomal protein L11 methyltransferase